uniref:Uncharacterized protein n=1 Tax=Oscillatoriales cyanobacterium SpSt-402 TaxID=2282168 RepID=A0A832H6A9_9CYAN
MNAPQTCPLCFHRALRHVRTGTVYWLCRHCHQEVPVLESSPNVQLLQEPSFRICRNHLFSHQKLCFLK